ncbi:hypothetical protein [Neorhizobium sp. P12A]|jgi:hypothetical protein|uniref:hypothetical protein n=1 Tax=Neorhizobium sp. P12A TaxID=2268027 RepID=UPI0011F05678|nr:hypothetical protein [Neorhizobium sp. P12A]
MTEDEFKQLTLRFGNDVAEWPAPYRQQALFLLAGTHDLPDRDEALDHLVLEAALNNVDERRMASQVLARIDADHDRRLGTRLSAFLLRPAAITACSTLLVLALAAGGYQLAASEGDALDARLLALATGAPASAVFLDLSTHDGMENAL